MKRIFTFLLLLVAVVAANAQKLQKAVPKGSKIFIEAPSKPVLNIALEKLGEWGYWQLAPTKEDADFLIYFIVEKRTTMDINFSADFVNKANKTVYSTRPVNSAKPRGGIEKLIDKRMIEEIGE
jgi:hypothetical protein